MAHTTFSDLPPEMVGNVFAFIRSKADQAAACLVSRAWRDHMAPIMWEILETDLSVSDHRSMVTLLNPDSGILPHVRELDIVGTETPNQEDCLKLLITALPRDKLRKFDVENTVNHLIFQQLLQSQSKLECIYVNTAITSLGQASDLHLLTHDYRVWTASLMSGVQQLILYLGLGKGNAEETFKNLREAFGAYSNLQDLILCYSNNFPDSLQNILFYASEGRMFYNLISVTFTLLDLVPNGSQRFCHNLDVAKLQHLELEECDFLVPFLDSLSKSYSEIPGALELLSIQLPTNISQPVETIRSIETLLKVCPKLLELALELAKCNLVSKDCLLSHADTLCSLVVGTFPSEQPVYFSRYDLGVILKACTKLKWLAINLPPVDLGLITELGQNFRLDGSEKGLAAFEGILAELSGHSTLHTLRMLNLPNIVFAHDQDDHRNPLMVDGSFVPSCDTTMQNFANQVIRYMGHQGRSPRIFHVEAIDVYGLSPYPDPDAKGCRRPHYTYTSGRIQDGLGMHVAVAVPLKNAIREFPDNFILQNSTT